MIFWISKIRKYLYAQARLNIIQVEASFFVLRVTNEQWLVFTLATQSFILLIFTVSTLSESLFSDDIVSPLDDFTFLSISLSKQFLTCVYFKVLYISCVVLTHYSDYGLIYWVQAIRLLFHSIWIQFRFCAQREAAGSHWDWIDGAKCT